MNYLASQKAAQLQLVRSAYKSDQLGSNIATTVDKIDELILGRVLKLFLDMR